jgi:hypothetical protein
MQQDGAEVPGPEARSVPENSIPDAVAVPACVLSWVCADMWSSDKKGRVEGSEHSEQVLSEIKRRRGLKVWIQLQLDGCTDDAIKAIEGDREPFEVPELPEVEWGRVGDTLEEIAKESRTFDKFQDLRGWLPYVYGIGANSSKKFMSKEPDRLFPILGFRPDKDSLWAQRTNVAVIDHIIITVRLPDRKVLGLSTKAAEYSADDSTALNVPDSLFPRTATADNIAEEIAINQAGTVRYAAELLRRRLQNIISEDSSLDEVIQKHLPSVRDINATVDRLDRQVSRLLRRFGSSPDMDPLVPLEARRRYESALEEILSVRNDCRQAEDALKAQVSEAERKAIEAGQEADRKAIEAKQKAEQKAIAAEQEAIAQFERILALVASIVLIPTLVAGIYGANTVQSPPGGFGAFIAFLVGSAAAATLFLNSVLPSRLTLLKNGLRCFVVAVALVCFGVALVLIL